MSTSLRVLIGALLSVAVMSSAALANDTPPGQAPTTMPVATTPQTTLTPPAGNASQTAPEQAGDKKIVCRKAPPPIGTRIGARKVCRTVADWRRQESIANETTTEIQRRKGYLGL